MYLGKDDILKADDLPVREVTVPEWPGDDGRPGVVRVRGLTGTERDRFEFALHRSDPDEVQVRAEFVGRCLVDEDGNRLFSDREITKLGEKSGKVMDRLFDVVRELSGIGKGADDEAAEDFGDAPDASSTSG